MIQDPLEGRTSARALRSVRPLGEFLLQLSVALTRAMAGSGGGRKTSTTSSQCSACGVEDRTLDSTRTAMVSASGDLVLERLQGGRELVIFTLKVDVGCAEVVTAPAIQCFTVSTTMYS